MVTAPHRGSEVQKMSRQYVIVNEINPNRLEEYRQAHRTMQEGKWREQLEVLRDAGAEICQAYLYKNFCIMIYVCDDIDKSFTRLGNDPRRLEWEEYTQPMFLNSPKFDGSVKTIGIEKIFDLNEQLDEGELSQF